MNRFIVLFVAILLTGTNAFSQTPRVRIDTVGDKCRPNDIAVVDDSMIVIAGYVGYNNSSGRRGIVYSIDRNLQMPSVAYDTGSFTTVFRSADFRRDTTMMFGYCYKSGKGYQGMIYKKFDGGNQVFDYGGNGDDYFMSGYKIKNSFYGIGYSQSLSGDTNHYTTAQDFYACKARLNGASVWQYAYGTGNQEWLNRAVPSFDSTRILLAGNTASIGQHGWDSAHAFFVLIDTSGIEVWRKEFSFDHMDDVDDVCATNDGFYFSAITEHQSEYYAVIGKLDLNGNIVWKKSLGFDSVTASISVHSTWHNGDPVSIKQLRNGDLLVAGEWENHTGPGYYNDGFIARFNANGDSLWRYDYHSSNNDWFTNTIEDSRGYLYACGYTNTLYTDFFGNGNLMIVKLDAYGCVMDTCLMPEIIVDPVDPADNNIYPNPFSTNLTIVIHQGDTSKLQQPLACNIYNSIGQIVKHLSWSTSSQVITLDTQSWADGLYIIEVNENGLVTKNKVIKQ